MSRNRGLRDGITRMTALTWGGYQAQTTETTANTPFRMGWIQDTGAGEGSRTLLSLLNGNLRNISPSHQKKKKEHVITANVNSEEDHERCLDELTK